eukprot:COSAG04_NODE_11831_length_685_cov_1.472696_1_plen_165_part_01
MAEGSAPPSDAGRKLALISAHMFLRVTISCQGLAAEPIFVGELCGGDASAAMKLLAQCSGAAGLLQFLLNPTFGTLSDRFGRKAFFLLGPAWCAFGNLLTALFPRSIPMFCVMRVLNRTLATMSGSTVCAAALSDCASGDALSVAFARLGSAASLGTPPPPPPPP